MALYEVKKLENEERGKLVTQADEQRLSSYFYKALEIEDDVWAP